MASENACIDAVQAYIDGQDADLYNLLTAESSKDALGTSFRLTRLAASAVQELGGMRQQEPSSILHSLLESRRDDSPVDLGLRFTHDELVWIGNVLTTVLNGPEAIEHWEFDAMIGGSPEDVRRLLDRINDRIDELRPANPQD